MIIQTPFSKTMLALAMLSAFAHNNAYADEMALPSVVLPSVDLTVYGQDLPTSVVAISQEQLDKQGTQTMADIVKYQPLVVAPSATTGSSSVWNGSGTTGYNIRGMDGNRVGLDVDGVELPNAGSLPDGQANNRYGIGRDYIDPELLKTVKIQAGSTNSDSDGLAGRVSFITKSPSDYVGMDNKLAAGYKASFFGANDTLAHTAHLAFGDDKLAALVMYSQKDGKQSKINSNIAPNPEEFSSQSVLAKVEFAPNTSHQISLTGEYYKKENLLHFDKDSVAMPALYPKGGMQQALVKRERLGLSYEATPEQFALFDKLALSAYYQDSTNQSQTDAYYVNSRTKSSANRHFQTALNTKTTGAKLTANKQFDNHRLSYGVEGIQTDESRPWTQYETDQTGTKITKNNRMPAMQTDKMAVYVSDFVKLGKLSLNPQLRYVWQRHKPTDLSDYLTQSPISQSLAKTEIKTSKDDYLSPGLTISYQALPDVLLYGKYNKSARLPTSSEKAGAYDGGRMYAVIGNPELKAETAHTYELGLKTDAWNGVSLALGGFYNQYKNYIDYRAVEKAQVPVGYSTLIRSQNINKVDIFGAELMTKFDLAKIIPNSQGFGLSFSYGISDYNAKDDKGQLVHIASVLPQKGVLGLTYDAPNGKYGVALTTTAVKGKRFDGVQDGFLASGYHTQDLTAYWRILPTVHLNVGLNNLFNKKYHDYATVANLSAKDTIQIERATMPERNLSASVQFSF